MDMGMVQDILAPRMQYAHEADICAQMRGIGSDLQECGCPSGLSHWNI